MSKPIPKRFSTDIERLRTHLVEQGYRPIECVDLFTRGASNETLVVHFSKDSPKLPGEEHLEYFDTPSTIVIMLNLQTGKISIPDLF